MRPARKACTEWVYVSPCIIAAVTSCIDQILPALISSWRPAALPAAHPLHDWLTDSASLTARIRARCQHLQVRVLGQCLVRVHADEALALGVRPDQWVWLREVLLIADGVPVVYARSVLAREAIRGAWRIFRGMGARPLGQALFADPQIRRGVLSSRKLDRRDARQRCAVRAAGLPADSVLWARRSCFTRGGKPLVVCEVFLPAVLKLES